MRIEEPPNRRLGRYQLTAVLGRGGMATVYRAHDTALRRDVALKVLYPQYSNDETLVERFKREAVLAAGLDHPNIVPIYDVGEIDGMAYIAMKLLDGRPLTDLLRGGQILPLPQVIAIVDQIASALDYAHSRGVVHRDIKAGNIIVEDDPDAAFSDPAAPEPPFRALLTDFGIAKSLDAPGMTSTGILIGTPDYMAPEQISNQPVDRRTDIYALGVLVFRCLTGQQPFVGSTEEVLLGHLHGTPPAPSVLNYLLPPAIDSVILKAMARQPDQRYATAGEFARALRVVAGLERPTPPPAIRRGFEDRSVVPTVAAREYLRPHADPDAATVRGTPTSPAARHAGHAAIARPADPAPRRRGAPVWLIVLLLLLIGGGGFTVARTLQSTAGGNNGGLAGGPTAAPTDTAAPTEPPATPTPELTTAEPTVAPAEPTAVPTNTQPPAPPTATRLPPTNTPVPASPTSTATPTPSPPPTATSTPPAAACNVPLVGGFGRLLERDLSIKERLGCPRDPEENRLVIEQPFEFGSMVFVKGRTRQEDRIYVIMRDEPSGVVRWQAFPNTWDAGEPEGGGELSPGRYEPTRGFGKLWRENLDVGNALGYGTAPEQGNDKGVYQPFEQGFLVYSPVNLDDGLKSGVGKDGKPLGLERDKPIFVFYNDGTFEQFED